ncbi:hypothetical protein RA307_04750 [Xanthobacteraceae bacterium Astr-EGSB]|uniref:hypothetical protein n=1 Tax=Astrobacterium formosum TaxID=3069710 RepID=UPI0027B4DC4F|nr:hypothetical protein [Xanthobacteraceae bacterium Astr-EGSB]
MKEKSDLVLRVALDLNVIGFGDALPAEEEADLSSRCDTLAAELRVRDKLFIPDLTRIPDEIFEPLAAVMVMRIGTGSGRAAPPTLEMEVAEERLRGAARRTAPRRTLGTDRMLRM